MNLVDLANAYRTQFYPYIPYRTGRLATTGMGDIYSPLGEKSVGFDFCNRSGLQYGIMLNEISVMHYDLNGRRGSYINRHLGYFDRFFDLFATQQAMLLNGELKEGDML